MSRKPFYLFVIAALCFIAVVVWCGKPVIIPNTAIGQEMFDVIVPVPDNTIRVIIGDKVYITDQNMYMFLGLMAVKNELELYSVECYADSIYDTSLMYLKLNETTARLEIDSTKYIHREPTFTGFMQFLEKKYEEEK